MQISHRTFYLVVLGSAFAVVVIALGGGFFNQHSPWQLQWQHNFFGDLCHQIADRSFWLNGQPMAVCSRCLGIYSGLFIGLLVLPILLKINETTAEWPAKKIAVLMLIFNIFDIIGSSFGLWQNTLISRFTLGYMLGHSAGFILAQKFFTKTAKSMEKYYGRVTERRSH